jgi:hypothetical protein
MKDTATAARNHRRCFRKIGRTFIRRKLAGSIPRPKIVHRNAAAMMSQLAKSSPRPKAAA